MSEITITEEEESMIIGELIERLNDEVYRLGDIDERELTEEEESLAANALTALEMIKESA